ncbi:MAG: hypothetical protein JXR95_13750 [Deltaproteobacteria bacterium]|nr:hypothetical protein [Deltaproteobacteria bacterium]
MAVNIQNVTNPDKVFFLTDKNGFIPQKGDHLHDFDYSHEYPFYKPDYQGCIAWEIHKSRCEQALNLAGWSTPEHTDN